MPQAALLRPLALPPLTPLLKMQTLSPELASVTPLANPTTGMFIDELKQRSISQKKLADACKVSPSIISDILSERRRISSEMALRFEITLGIEAEFILKLQQTYELKKFKSEQAPQLAKELQPIPTT